MENIENITEQEIVEFFNDSAAIVTQYQTDALSVTAADVTSKFASGVASNDLVNAFTKDVEYWKWMGQNFPNTYGSPEMIASTAQKILDGGKSGLGHANQLQGKLYEWNAMVKLRNNPANLLARFDAGTNPSQPGIDITKTDILGNKTTYQNKAYLTSSPDLSNTPKDAIIITNQENAAYAREQGYEAIKFKKADSIKADNERMLRDAVSKTNTSYNFANIAKASAKAGAVSFAIGCTVEAIMSYRQWKNGEIDGLEYLKRVSVAGGHAGAVGAATAGIMIPISAAITAAGIAAPITLPVTFIVGAVLDKIAAPIFKRGDYQKLLQNAIFYCDASTMYNDLSRQVEISGAAFKNFVLSAVSQRQTFEAQRVADRQLTGALEDLYNKI